MIEETGWCIEHETSPVYAPLYLSLVTGQIEWSKDNLKAFRMARKEDAEAFSRIFLAGRGRVADHMWCDYS